GIFVPLLVAAVPIALGTRVTVRQALDRHGAAPPAPGRAWLSTSARAGWLGRDLLLASRNVFRRRIRLGLTLALLATGGAVFLTALNTSRGWESIVHRVYETRSYDLEVRLNAPATVAERLRLIPGVRTVEAWGYSRSAFSRSGEVDVVRTYPDGSHGSLALMGPPADTALVHLPLIAGRWLVPGDTDAVVLNHGALRQTPATRVGDQVTLSLDGRPTVWRVVGIVEEVGAAGVAYVTDGAFAQAAGSTGRVRMLRIDTDAESDSERANLIHAVEDLLAREHTHVEALIPLSILRTAMGDHVIVLIRLLLAMAMLLLIVGLLGLASTMSTNVIERTREIGVMKTLGATPRQIARLVLAEGLLIAGMSWLLAVALAVPLSVLVGRTVGLLSFGIRLPLQAHWGGVAIWLGLVVLVTLLATLLPARRASKLTVSRALAQL
ncbi:MAG: hypothetical protein RL033_4763, partial [Pseudomonadota bacterium]